MAISSAVNESRDFRVIGNGPRPDETRLTALPNTYAATASGARAMSLAFYIRCAATSAEKLMAATSK